MDLIEIDSKQTVRHPWERARADFLMRIIESSDALPQNGQILDVGAGDAWFANQLVQTYTSSHVTCVDSFYNDQTITKLNSIYQCSRQVLTNEVPDTKQYDLITLLDVLEHIEDDRTFLESLLQKNLKKEGRVLITVPAWQFLYSAHDKHLKHFRRYSPAAGRKLVTDSGLSIIESGTFFQSLFFVRCLQKLLVWKDNSDETPQTLGTWAHSSTATSLITNILNVENRAFLYLNKLNLSFPGLSWWALCQKSK